LRAVSVTRYVMPFREGDSLPALVEADDDGLYVVKLRGAAQGPKALVAELLGGELARALGLSVPEIVRVDVDAALARAEPDPEISEILERSVGENLALDFLPGSAAFDAVAGPSPDATTASRTVLFDAFALNVDRTPRNTNLLVWHDRIHLIDHGAAFYFHHGWGPGDRLAFSDDPFAEVKDHVLLPFASRLDDAADHLARVFTDELFGAVVDAVPASLFGGPGGGDADELRAAYRAWLRARVAALPAITEEAERARAMRV
ncbi:MAG TPA: HipA family kinase, partial [Minicystis sp.]|nr:HipA family kinase [Minicystis sp.]